MDRFLPLDVTLQTLSAHLYPDERILTHADSVGLYDGKDKSPRHTDGRAVLTTHRVLFVSSARPHSNSAYLPLSLVKQTEFWAGFLKSSAKITLLLAESTPPLSSSAGSSGPTSASSPTTSTAMAASSGDLERDKDREARDLAALAGERNWVCRVCGMHNVPTVELGLKCSLCGVTRDAAANSSRPTSRLGPPSRLSTPPPSTPASPPGRSGRGPAASPASSGPPPPPPELEMDPTETGSRLACPVCTFLNHHSMTRCEVCDSVLLPPSRSNTLSGSAARRHPVVVSVGGVPSRSTTPGLSTDPASAAPPPGGSGAAFVRLSFRNGGEKPFYALLKEALAAKAWDWVESGGHGSKSNKAGTKGPGALGGTGGSSSSAGESTGGVGIDAILRGVDLDARDREDSLDDALKDLESLMAKAKEMITLAQSINAQLSSSSGTLSTSDPGGPPSSSSSSGEAAQAASLASTSLHSLGLLTTQAVTPDLVADDRAYHLELAKELAGVLDKGRIMEKRGGIMGLDEVWCLWNRARGVALVSPKDLRLAAPHLPTLPPSASHTRLSLRTFHPSGLTILHTPRFAPAAFEARVLDLLDTRQALAASLADSGLLQQGEGIPGGDGEPLTGVERQGVSLLEVASAESISIGLAKELLAVVELGAAATGGAATAGSANGGGIVRDEQAGEGTRWYRNWITGAEWDGQVF